MAYSTTNPTSSKSDWYTFLRSAFINGLKAYGASLMTVGAPGPSHLGTGDNYPTLPGAPGPSHLGILESSPTGPKPAGRPIHCAASPRNGWETMNSALDWTRA